MSLDDVVMFPCYRCYRMVMRIGVAEAEAVAVMAGLPDLRMQSARSSYCNL
jgi:hypothetical protein